MSISFGTAWGEFQLGKFERATSVLATFVALKLDAYSSECFGGRALLGRPRFNDCASVKADSDQVLASLTYFGNSSGFGSPESQPRSIRN